MPELSGDKSPLHQSFRSSEAPRRMNRFRQNIFRRSFKVDTSRPSASPGPFDRHEHLGMVLREVVLVLRRQFDHAASLVGIAERGKDLAGDPEVGMIHVLTLLSFGKREGKFAEVLSGHGYLLKRLCQHNVSDE